MMGTESRRGLPDSSSVGEAFGHILAEDSGLRRGKTESFALVRL